MRLFLFISFLVSSAWLYGQNSIFGPWEGVITQNEGGYRSEYVMQCSFILEGDEVKGRTYIYVDDIFVEMEVKGKVHSDVLLRLEDVRIIDSEEQQGMEWCMKSYQLVLKRVQQEWHLEGYWQGTTTFSRCVPGKVKLKREIPRS